MSWHGNQFQARLRCLSLTADTKLVAVPANLLSAGGSKAPEINYHTNS